MSFLMRFVLLQTPTPPDRVLQRGLCFRTRCLVLELHHQQPFRILPPGGLQRALLQPIQLCDQLLDTGLRHHWPDPELDEPRQFLPVLCYELHEPTRRATPACL
jgi:hypothetical protein